MNFNSFSKEVSQNAADAGARWVYRGQADAGWPLNTSYGRFHTRAFGEAATFDLASFHTMLNAFIKKASESAGETFKPLSTFERVALAQHHGIPTPLLDWSYSPYVAAYFAVGDDSREDQPSEFAIYALNVVSLDILDLTDEQQVDLFRGTMSSFCLLEAGQFMSRRLTRQAGCFTFQNFGGCLRAWLAASKTQSVQIKKYPITGSKTEIAKELDLMGINGGTLFDDFDYIAQDVVRAELSLRRGLRARV